MRVPRLPRRNGDAAAILAVIVGLPIAVILFRGGPVIPILLAGLGVAAILLMLRR